jgi:hypothetical protein
LDCAEKGQQRHAGAPAAIACIRIFLGYGDLVFARDKSD